MLIFRTGIAGSWGQCPNEDGSPMKNAWGDLIHYRHVEQLNAAARTALQKHSRWQIMDLEVLVADCNCPRDYLRDDVHVSKDFTWNILNSYANMLSKSWKLHGVPPWRAQPLSTFLLPVF